MFQVEVGTEHLGGRLAHYVENWKVLGTDSWVVNTLEQGYKWQLTARPPLMTHPLVVSTPRSLEVELGMDQLLAKLLNIKAVERVVNRNSPGFYSRWFVVPKKQPGQWRAVLDLSRFNEYVVKETFKMETAEMV